MRFSLVFALFVAVPLLAFGQRYGGAGMASVARPDQRTAPPTSSAPATPKQGQERVQNNEVRLGWQWWKDADVRKQLQLTDRQVQQISLLYDDRVRQIRPTWEALQKHQTELDKMRRERTVDVATYSLQVTNAEGLRSEVNKTRYVLVYAISRRLSAEQHQKLQEVLEKRFGRGGGPSPRR